MVTVETNLEKQYYVFGVVFFVLVGVCAIAISCRLYVRVYLRGNLLKPHRWSWSDRLLTLVWLGYLGCGIANGMIRFTYGWTPETIDNYAGEPHFVDGRRLQYVYVTMFWVFIFLLKGAMLCFFDEFVSKDTYFKSWVAIRVLAVLVVIAGVSTFIWQLLWCQPFHRVVDGIKADNCWNDVDARLRYTTYRQIWHVVLDIMILLIPIPLMPLLKHVSIRQWIGLIIMLLLGFFCVASAITFTLGVLNWDNGTLRSVEANWFLNYEPVAEMCAGILIQCIPSIRFVLRGQGRKSPGSYSAGVGSGSGSNGGSLRNRLFGELRIRSFMGSTSATRASQAGDGIRSHSYAGPNGVTKPVGKVEVNIDTLANSNIEEIGHPELAHMDDLVLKNESPNKNKEPDLEAGVSKPEAVYIDRIGL